MSVELNDITSGYSTGLINDNFQLVEDELNNNVLRRNGLSSGEANQMEVGLDMNSNFVYNLPEPVLEHQAARLQDVQNALADNSANLITFTPYGNISSENVQGAIQELVDGTGQSVTTSTGTQTLVDALNNRATNDELATLREDTLLETNLTVNIPTDYATLQAAIDDLSTRTVKQGAIIDLLIETGHQPTAGINVTNGDYNHFRVSSVDAEVTLASSFPSGTDFIASIDATAPILNCLVNANGLARYGVNCQRGAHITVSSGCGVKNADQRGIYLNENSTASASHTVWTGVGTVVSTGLARGAWIARGSTLIGENADFSNSTGIGVYISRASTVHAMDLKAENCTDQAVWVHRSSRITAHSVANGGVLLSTKSSSVTPVVRIARSSLASLNADAGTAPVTITQNGTGEGVVCRASLCEINSADLVGGSNSNNGIECSGGGTVNASNATISGFNDGINNNGGTVNAPLVSVSSSRNVGANTLRGDTNLASGSVTGSSNVDINNSNGAFTRADGCSTTNGTGSPAIGDTNMGSFNSLDSRGAVFT